MLTKIFRNEFFLADYLYKVGNYDVDYVCSAFATEGYLDLWNFNDDLLFSEEAQAIRQRRLETMSHDVPNNKYIAEFCIIPNTGFLSNSDPLVKDVELKLSFDRSNIKQYLMAKDADWKQWGDLKVDIKNCYAVTEHVSSPSLRTMFSSIDYTPFRYEYEECEVLVKTIPQNETNIRFDNLRGGNTPSYMFVGFIETDALRGEGTKSSTRFSPHKIQMFNINLNGNSVNGYPLQVRNSIPTQCYQKFISSTNRLCNINGGKMLGPNEFQFNWLWSHKFEVEDATTGWLGINFKLLSGYDVPMTMVVWIISPTAITIDKFHQLEKINL